VIDMAGKHRAGCLLGLAAAALSFTLVALMACLAVGVASHVV
jgi:hypothetical protein